MIYRIVPLGAEGNLKHLSHEEYRLAMHLLLGGQTNPLGYYRFLPEVAAAATAITVAKIRSSLPKILRALTIEYDPRNHVIYIPWWWSLNGKAIRSPKHLHGLMESLATVPDSPLIDKFKASTEGLCPVCAEALPELVDEHRVTHGAVPWAKQDEASMPIQEEGSTGEQTSSSIAIPGTTTQNTEQEPPSSPPKGAECETRFEEIWKRYPRKLGKDAAFRHFKAQVKTDADWSGINRGLDKYLADILAKGIEERFIKHGSAWFNDLWKDWRDKAKGGVPLPPPPKKVYDRITDVLSEIKRQHADKPEFIERLHAVWNEHKNFRDKLTRSPFSRADVVNMVQEDATKAGVDLGEQAAALRTALGMAVTEVE